MDENVNLKEVLAALWSGLSKNVKATIAVCLLLLGVFTFMVLLVLTKGLIAFVLLFAIMWAFIRYLVMEDQW